LDPKDAEMAPCEGLTRVRVDDLADSPNGTCDLQGVTVVFPDGMEVVAPAFAATRETAMNVAPGTSDWYTLFNFGSYGLVAAQTDPDRTSTEWWGLPEGIQKEQDASGPVVK